MSAAPNLQCPRCKGSIAHDSALAGQQVTCPHCNAKLKMPAAAAPQKAPPVSIQEPGPAETGFPAINPVAAQSGPVGSRYAGGRKRKPSALLWVAIGVPAAFLGLRLIGAIVGGSSDHQSGEDIAGTQSSKVQSDVAAKAKDAVLTYLKSQLPTGQAASVDVVKWGCIEPLCDCWKRFETGRLTSWGGVDYDYTTYGKSVVGDAVAVEVRYRFLGNGKSGGVNDETANRVFFVRDGGVFDSVDRSDFRFSDYRPLYK